MNTSAVGRSRHPIQGVTLSIFLLLLTLASVWLFTQRYWWMTPVASDHGREIDYMLYVTLGITGVLFVLLQLFLALVTVRFRNRGADTAAKAVRSHVENRFALIAGILILGVDLTVFALGESRWFDVWRPAPKDSAIVEVTASQFMWHFRYPGKDGTFGRASQELISIDNPVGLDLGDAASTDDVVVANELHIEGNRPVRLLLKAKDVIHSFYLPNFRVKQDVVPGMHIEVWFVPREEGRFEIVCNQLCGMLHHKMRGFLVVEPAEKVQAWLAELPQAGGN